MTIRKILTTTSIALVATALAASTAWARGGAGRPPLPGQGARNGDDTLRDRQARNRWLREKGRNPSTAPLAPPAPQPNPAPSRAQARQPAATPDTSLVHMHHGKVRMIGDLARVDLTLEVQNVGPANMEWRRTYAIDPSAEILGAVLLRRNELPLRARTLSTGDAMTCYARVRTPPPTRSMPPRRPRDPLLVTRPTDESLHIQIWPIAPQESVRVELTFVTPLRGHGARRTYVDVMGGPTGVDERAPRLSRPDRAEERERGPTTMVAAQADWSMQPGDLVLSSAKPSGMTYSGEAGGRLQFTGTAATRRDQPAPTVPFLARRRHSEAIYVGGGSYQGRIAMFRFDPREYLLTKGFVLEPGLTARLVPEKGSMRRLTPAEFDAYDPPRPVTGQVTQRTADAIRYRVEVRGRDGRLVESYAETLALSRTELGTELEAAVTGWHRAQLARHTFHWASANAHHRRQALRYAVDLGVLVPGTAALAIPPNERARLTPRLRRIYLTDGVPLGAARGEADLKQPPKGAFDGD